MRSVAIFHKYASVFFPFIPIILKGKNAASSLIVTHCGVLLSGSYCLQHRSPDPGSEHVGLITHPNCYST